MILTVLFYLFVAFTGIQIIYYLFFSTFLFKQKKGKKTVSKNPISVIIFAKNQAKNLQQFLPSILNQNYPEFEIVLINNASIDNTDEVLESLKNKHSSIKIVNVANNETFWGSKKYALTLGIKAAKYNHLLFTEANSTPVSKNWIAEINSNFYNTKTIIIGFSKIKKENTFGNLLMRFENILTAIKCFSFAKAGIPYKAFKNNFAYHRKEFYNAKGFINHMKIKEGETDLFLKDAATKTNIKYCISPESFVEKKAPNNFYKWLLAFRKNKKLSKHLKTKHRFLLSFFTFSKAVFYILAVILFCYYSYQITLPLFILTLSIQLIVFGISAKKLKDPYLIFFFPILEISLILIQISIFITNLVSKPNYIE